MRNAETGPQFAFHEMLLRFPDIFVRRKPNGNLSVRIKRINNGTQDRELSLDLETIDRMPAVRISVKTTPTGHLDNDPKAPPQAVFTLDRYEAGEVALEAVQPQEGVSIHEVYAQAKAGASIFAMYSMSKMQGESVDTAEVASRIQDDLSVPQDLMRQDVRDAFIDASSKWQRISTIFGKPPYVQREDGLYDAPLLEGMAQNIAYAAAPELFEVPVRGASDVAMRNGANFLRTIQEKGLHLEVFELRDINSGERKVFSVESSEILPGGEAIRVIAKDKNNGEYLEYVVKILTYRYDGPSWVPVRPDQGLMFFAAAAFPGQSEKTVQNLFLGMSLNVDRENVALP